MQQPKLATLHHLSRKVKHRVDVRMQQFGLTGQQARVILFIGRKSKQEDVFQRTIEEEYQIRPSSVTSILKLLEKNGYIMRESVPEDARLKKLLLTKSGEAIREQIKMVIDEEDNRVMSMLTIEEQDHLFHILTKLLETLREAPND